MTGWALQPKPGTRLGARFEILEEIGRGGMATVYRARDLRSGVPVAVKVLRAGDAEDVERFAREVILLRELAHPGIVRLVADGRALGGASYLVEEWIDGESLRARLRRGGLDVAESVAVVRAAAEALSEAHAKGIVHRDVKPENLLFPRAGGLKVVDFGVARRLDDRFTRTGVAVGTPAYMPPEQARGDRDLDARVDVFALGCVLYECLTGEAFTGGTRELGLGAPPALVALVLRMLAERRELRPADAGEVAAALAGIDAPATPPRRGVAAEACTLVTDGPPARLVFVVLVDDGTVHHLDGAHLAELAGEIAALQKRYPGRAMVVAAGEASDDILARAATLLAGAPPGITLDPVAAELLANG